MGSANSRQILDLAELLRHLWTEVHPSSPAQVRALDNALALLDPLPPMDGELAPSSHAVADILPLSRWGRVEPQAVLDALLPLAQWLPWAYHYEWRHDAPDLGSRMAFAELIGPEAPMRSDRVCLGLTFMAPHTLYPDHRHPATELYYVVAGPAAWTLDGVEVEHAPGSFILHPSNAIHSMRTREEALLAVYIWIGEDVKSSSVYTD